MALQEFTLGNKTLKIVHDSCPLNPRTDWDPLGTLVLANGNGDKTDFKFEDNYRSEADVLERAPKEIEKHFKGVEVILPVYKYEHSGVIYSTTPFSCPWDSCLAGFIFVTRKQIKENFGINKYARIPQDILDKIPTYLEGEIETFSQWASGEVYGFKLEEDGEETDSCYGFFGGNLEENGILDHIGEEWKEVLKGETV